MNKLILIFLLIFSPMTSFAGIVYSCFGDQNESLIVSSEDNTYTILVSSSQGNEMFQVDEAVVKKGDQFFEVDRSPASETEKPLEFRIEKVEIVGNQYELKGILKAKSETPDKEINLELSCTK